MWLWQRYLEDRYTAVFLPGLWATEWVTAVVTTDGMVFTVKYWTIFCTWKHPLSWLFGG